jgi:thiol-disulfide isomerase/thioredoxin
MKKLFLSILMLTSVLATQAQSSIADGTICPNITITDKNGVSHDLYDYCNQGKIVVIDFFAYWCGTCKQTAPTVDLLYKKYGCNTGNLIVLGNDTDPSGTAATLAQFDAGANLSANSYPAGFGGAGTNAANKTTFGVAGTPTIVMIGPDKKMIKNYIWPFNVAAVEALFPSTVTLTAKGCFPAAINTVSKNVATVSITPNPAAASATLQMDLSQSANIQYSIVDLLGKTIYASTTKNYTSGTTAVTIPVQQIASGMYLVNVIADQQKVTTLKLTIN